MLTSPAPLEPGPMKDGDLELVTPSQSLLDELMASLAHPQTQQLMPELANVPRAHWIDFLAKAPNGFDPGNEETGIVPAYFFWMRRATSGESLDLPIVGTIGLRIGNNQNVQQIIGHIGYNVYPFARGHHYAERACRLLFPLARRHALGPIWITCNPDNIPSRRTCERLGATLVDIVPIPPDHPLHARGERYKCRYRIDL